MVTGPPGCGCLTVGRQGSRRRRGRHSCRPAGRRATPYRQCFPALGPARRHSGRTHLPWFARGPGDPPPHRGAHPPTSSPGPDLRGVPVSSPRYRVGVLHPGAMGAAVAAQARESGHDVLWCPAGRSPASVQRARSAGLCPVSDLAELLAACEIVLSVCPPAAAEDVARAVAVHDFTGIYVEANAISPTRVQRIASLLTAAGSHVIDAAIMGAPPAADRCVRLYLCGEPGRATRPIATVSGVFTGTQVQTVALDGGLGTASALKMAHAQYQKAARALAAVSHALATRYEITDHLIAEAERNASSPLAHPEYLPSVAARAWRWAPEMHEVTDTLDAAGLPSDLARAASEVLTRWTPDKDADLPLDVVLRHLGTW
ncbi:MAG: DUF1932 domain-containing protein [Actinomycetales bacterium]|nr:DUF1932 domain-containing protein [Actinomycetales bacterium]